MRIKLVRRKSQAINPDLITKQAYAIPSIKYYIKDSPSLKEALKLSSELTDQQVYLAEFIKAELFLYATIELIARLRPKRKIFVPFL